MADLYVSESEVADQMLRIQKALRSFESDSYNLNKLLERIHTSKAIQSSATHSLLQEKAGIVTGAIEMLKDSFSSLEPTITGYLLELDEIDNLLE